MILLLFIRFIQGKPTMKAQTGKTQEIQGEVLKYPFLLGVDRKYDEWSPLAIAQAPKTLIQCPLPGRHPVGCHSLASAQESRPASPNRIFTPAVCPIHSLSYKALQTIFTVSLLPSLDTCFYLQIMCSLVTVQYQLPNIYCHF